MRRINWRFGEPLQSLVNSMPDWSSVAQDSTTNLLVFHDESPVESNTSLGRIHTIGMWDPGSLDTLVRKLSPDGVSINFMLSDRLFSLFANTTQLAWENYLRCLSSRIRRGAICVMRAGSSRRITEVRCQAPPF